MYEGVTTSKDKINNAMGFALTNRSKSYVFLQILS